MNNKEHSTFMVPARFDLESIDEIVVNNAQFSIPIEELYGSLNNSNIGSGRKYFELPNVDIPNLTRYVHKLHEIGLFFNYVLNLSCLSNEEFTINGQKKVLNHIQTLIDIGITRFTVAVPSIIDLFDAYFPNVNITLSVITGVCTLSTMKEYCSYRNIKTIYIHEKVYRNIELLSDLVKIAHNHGKKVGVIVNSFCLSDCPYRYYHYNFGAHATVGADYVIPEFYGSKCALMKIYDPRKVLTAPWIRPDDLQLYVDLGIDKFKISGREMHANGADMVKVVKTYNSKTYDGNLTDLFMCFTKCAYSEIFNIENNSDLDKYIKAVLSGSISCNRNGCTNCMLCQDALKCITTNKEQVEKYKKLFEDRIERFRCVNA